MNKFIEGYQKLEPNFNVKFYGVFINYGSPKYFTCINQWFDYLRTHNLTTLFENIQTFGNKVSFGENGKHRVEVDTLGRISIGVQ